METQFIDDKKLIAAFLGKPVCHDKVPAYDSDWNELMPVIEKIETIQLPSPSITPIKVKISGNSCRIFKGEWNDDVEGFISFVSYTGNAKQYSKVEATYLAAVEFIKFYNKITKEQS